MSDEEKRKVILGELFEFKDVVKNKPTQRDHDIVHELYGMYPKIKFLVGKDNMGGPDLSKLEELHTSIVEYFVDNNINHYYESWNGGLDHSLPDELKEKTIGYPMARVKRSGIFGFEECSDLETKFFEDIGREAAKELWSAPKNRKDLPASYFLDGKNKKYPVKDPKTGKYNCTALRTAAAYASGARGAPKRPVIAAKAKRLYKIHCGGDKK